MMRKCIIGVGGMHAPGHRHSTAITLWPAAGCEECQTDAHKQHLILHGRDFLALGLVVWASSSL